MAARLFRVYLGAWASVPVDIEITDEELAKEFDGEEFDDYDVKNLALEKALDRRDVVDLCWRCDSSIDISGSLDIHPAETLNEAVEELK